MLYSRYREVAMYFSEIFGVDKKLISEYGAIDISLTCDLPLFIDPMLIFNSQKDEYKTLHDYLIKFFAFLTKKSEDGVNIDELNSYFKFPEIKNNWLGYSKFGNGGRGLGKEFANFLSQNLRFIMADNQISKSKHIEKALLIYDGNGKDKISDLTTNLILDYLATYTQQFAKQHISQEKINYFYLNSKFNFETETFECVEYELPFFINSKGEEEFVLLTPYDILREEDPAISKINLKRMYNRVRNGISNETHRAQLNQYINRAVREYIAQQKKKDKKKKISDAAIEYVEKSAFFQALKEKEFAWLYDYFIQIIEESGIEINQKAMMECVDQIEKYYRTSEALKALLIKNGNQFVNNATTAREELQNKLNFLKDTIENNEGYKLLYFKDQCITSEDNLQRLFRFTLDGTPYDFNFDANNGLGEYDIKASKGSADKCIAELKLASNPKLTSMFEQAKVYERANKCIDSIFVVFYFNQAEKAKLDKLFREDQNFKDKKDDIILIDCRKDNKISASKI